VDPGEREHARSQRELVEAIAEFQNLVSARQELRRR
jgi:hypothetical protein